jgi:hypothetical protein
LRRWFVTGIEVALALAVLIGASLGMLGGGGSMITMPVLVYVAGVDPKRAVVMSLAIVGGTSLAGSYLHYREDNFHGKAAGLFGISGVIGAYFGGMLTHLPAILMADAQFRRPDAGSWRNDARWAAGGRWTMRMSHFARSYCGRICWDAHWSPRRWGGSCPR